MFKKLWKKGASLQAEKSPRPQEALDSSRVAPMPVPSLLLGSSNLDRLADQRAKEERTFPSRSLPNGSVKMHKKNLSVDTTETVDLWDLMHGLEEDELAEGKSFGGGRIPDLIAPRRDVPDRQEITEIVRSALKKVLDPEKGRDFANGKSGQEFIREVLPLSEVLPVSREISPRQSSDYGYSSGRVKSPSQSSEGGFSSRSGESERGYRESERGYRESERGYRESERGYRAGESDRGYRAGSAKSPSRQSPVYTHQRHHSQVPLSEITLPWGPDAPPAGGKKMRRASLQVSKSTGNLAELELLSPAALASPGTLKRRLTFPVPAIVETEEDERPRGRRALSINGHIDAEVTGRPLVVKMVKKNGASGELSGPALGLRKIKTRDDISVRAEVGNDPWRAEASSDPWGSLRVRTTRDGERESRPASRAGSRDSRGTPPGGRDSRGTPPGGSSDVDSRALVRALEKVAWGRNEKQSPPRLIERVAGKSGRSLSLPVVRETEESGRTYSLPVGRETEKSGRTVSLPVVGESEKSGRTVSLPVVRAVEKPLVEELSAQLSAERPAAVARKEEPKEKPRLRAKSLGLPRGVTEVGLLEEHKEVGRKEVGRKEGGRKEVGLHGGEKEEELQGGGKKREAPARDEEAFPLVETEDLDEIAKLRRISEEVSGLISERARRRGMSEMPEDGFGFGSPISNVGPLFDPAMLASFEEDLQNTTEEEWRANQEERNSFSFTSGGAPAAATKRGGLAESSLGGAREKVLLSAGSGVDDGGLEEVISEVESFLSRLEKDAVNPLERENAVHSQRGGAAAAPEAGVFRFSARADYEKQSPVGSPEEGGLNGLLALAEGKPARSPKGSPRGSLGKPPLSPKRPTKNGYPPSSPKGGPPRGSDRVVVYTTSVRAVRKTFEECNAVRGVFLGHGVAVDERDISMHGEFRDELRALMGGPVAVPRVFIRGQYVGGAEDIQRLNDCKELLPLLEGFDRHQGRNACKNCAGVRFHLCHTCNGSCKVVCGANPDNVVRCPDCNENGLRMCAVCA